MLLTKKYTPKTLDDLILPKRIKDEFLSGNPLLLFGPPGCGKTSSVDILSGRWNGGSLLRINCSLTTGIDYIRTNVVDFCSRGDLLSTSTKTVILDEFEGVSEEYFKALRGVMEEFSNIKWLATTNYIASVPDPIKSRFTLVDFNFTPKDTAEIKIDYAKWVMKICKEEEMTLTKDGITSLLNRYFPDFRQTLLKLSSCKSKGIKEITKEIIEDNSIVSNEELFEHIINEKSDSKTFTYVHTEFGRNVSETFFSLSREFPKYLMTKGLDSKIGDIAVTVHKYSYESKFSIDIANSLYCCIVSLKKIIQK